jgi:hypothetical protein
MNFDTIYNINSLGLPKYPSHYSFNVVDGIVDIYNDYINGLNTQIDQLKQQIQAAKRGGQQQKEYLELQEITVKLMQEIEKLKVQKAQLTNVRDTWNSNPQVAEANYGMGYKGRSKTFWGEDIMWSSVKKIPIINEKYTIEERRLLEQISDLKAELADIGERIAPQNIGVIRSERARLEQEKAKLTEEIKSLTDEINNLKNAYSLRKETEKLALEQERQQREANAQAVNAKAQSKKQNNTILLVAGAAILGWVLLSGDDKKHVTVTV